jgi:hypothetical protein
MVGTPSAGTVAPSMAGLASAVPGALVRLPPPSSSKCTVRDERAPGRLLPSGPIMGVIPLASVLPPEPEARGSGGWCSRDGVEAIDRDSLKKKKSVHHALLLSLRFSHTDGSFLLWSRALFSLLEGGLK